MPEYRPCGRSVLGKRDSHIPKFCFLLIIWEKIGWGNNLLLF